MRALAARVGSPPERLETVADVGAELRHLHQATAPEALAPWDDALDAILSALSRFSRAHQPGFVFGLRRHHHAVAETWTDDAARWWERLGQDAAA